MIYPLSRRSFTNSDQAEIWQLWSGGKSLSEIGRQINKHAGSIFCFLAKYGGIKPVPSKRKANAINLYEREEISRGLSANLSIRAISPHLNRHASTISREIKRNGGIINYRAISADKRAWQNAKRPKPCNLNTNAKLRSVVERQLEKKCSPEQISGHLRRLFPRDKTMQISHETIYRTLYIQARGALKKTLQRQLRTQRMMRQSKKMNTKGNPRGGIIDAVSIHDRPKEVDDRAIPGYWEGDLICGTNRSYIATLVERTSRFTVLVKLKSNSTQAVISALKPKVIGLPKQLKKSLTWDRGMELANHSRFTVDTTIKVYFCDPRSPWQRGTNENTNRLLRQYLPKKSDLSIHSQKQLDSIAQELNERPRKTLQFLSPAEKINQVLR